MFSISIVYDFLLNLFDLSYVFLFSPEMSTSLGLTRIIVVDMLHLECHGNKKRI